MNFLGKKFAQHSEYSDQGGNVILLGDMNGEMETKRNYRKQMI